MDTDGVDSTSANSGGAETTILFIDDEPKLVETYAALLESEYRVLTETSGEDAVDRVDETVDVVFLDRRMPTRSGDEVLAEIRQRGYSMPIAMLTAVKPDTDIVDMPFDDYLTKPANRTELLEKVNVLTNRAAFNDTSRELYRLASKKAALEAEGIDAATRETYQRLTERMNELRAEMDSTLDEIVDDDPSAAFRDL